MSSPHEPERGHTESVPYATPVSFDHLAGYESSYAATATDARPPDERIFRDSKTAIRAGGASTPATRHKAKQESRAHATEEQETKGKARFHSGQYPKYIHFFFVAFIVFKRRRDRLLRR